MKSPHFTAASPQGHASYSSAGVKRPLSEPGTAWSSSWLQPFQEQPWMESPPAGRRGCELDWHTCARECRDAVVVHPHLDRIN